MAYLDVVTELRRLIKNHEEDRHASTKLERPKPSESNSRQSRRYRIKKDFDSIDRDDFRRQAFSVIEEYFRRSTDELNEIGDPIRARFEKIDDSSFSCTVLNKAARNKEAHITIRNGDDGLFGGDAISYSFSRRSMNSANGFIQIEANEYELYLKMDGLSLRRTRRDEPMSSEESADVLWREFIANAGIDHE